MTSCGLARRRLVGDIHIVLETHTHRQKLRNVLGCSRDLVGCICRDMLPCPPASTSKAGHLLMNLRFASWPSVKQRIHVTKPRLERLNANTCKHWHSHFLILSLSLSFSLSLSLALSLSLPLVCLMYVGTLKPFCDARPRKTC